MNGFSLSIKNTLVKHNSKSVFIVNNTPLFSSKRNDGVNGTVVCDKYDIFSLGCVLYHILMDDYLPHPMSPDTK